MFPMEERYLLGDLILVSVVKLRDKSLESHNFSKYSAYKVKPWRIERYIFVPNCIHNHFVGKNLSLVHNQQSKNVEFFFC